MNGRQQDSVTLHTMVPLMLEAKFVDELLSPRYTKKVAGAEGGGQGTVDGRVRDRG